MNQKTIGVLSIVLLLMLAVACGAKEEKINPIQKIEDKVEKEVQSKEVKAKAPQENKKEEQKGFGSIEKFTTRFGEMTEYMNQGAEKIDDMTFMGDSMALLLAGGGVLDAQLDYALHMGKEEWQDEKKEMPNGAGEYESGLEKKGDIYHYFHKNHWTETGHVDRLLLDYDKKNQWVIIEKGSDDPQKNAIKVQFYLTEKGDLYLSLGQSVPRMESHEMLIAYYDGKHMNFARITNLKGTEVSLPVDLTLNKPSSWAEFIGDKTYGSLFLYDSETVKYEHLK